MVEDEGHLADTIAFNLEAEGYLVEIAANLAAARAILSRINPDLIILDAMLPDGDGFLFCADLRAAGNFTPVLMLTARSNQQDIVEGLTKGADDYLTKPFDLDELLGRVSAQLRRRTWSQRRSTDTIQLGHRQIDLRSGNISSEQEKTHKLGEVETKLLRFLATHQGQDVDRARILAAVWNLPPDKARSRTLDTHILRLRKRVEDDPAHPQFVLTVHGTGYRLEGAS